MAGPLCSLYLRDPELGPASMYCGELGGPTRMDCAIRLCSVPEDERHPLGPHKKTAHLPGTSETKKDLPMHSLANTDELLETDCSRGRRRKRGVRVKILSPRGPLGLFCDHHLVMKLVGKHIDKTGVVGFFFTFIISDVLSNTV